MVQMMLNSKPATTRLINRSLLSNLKNVATTGLQKQKDELQKNVRKST